LSNSLRPSNRNPDPPALIPQPGERALIVGQTGSGKTAFVIFMLKRMRQSPIVLYDTKEEPKFLALPDSVIVTGLPALTEEIKNGTADYIIFRPDVHLSADHEALDQLLLYHYDNFSGIPVYIDEVYAFHNNGKAGPGLIACLTRGRSRGITVIMSTQRPAWLSMFAMTETQRFYVFALTWRKDRMKMGEAIPDFEDLPLPKKHGFWFYRQGSERPVLYAPITLEPGTEQGYTDEVTYGSNASEPNSHKTALWI
jgi:hypothetical protein